MRAILSRGSGLRRGVVAVALVAATLIACNGALRAADAPVKKRARGIPGVFLMDPDGSNPRPLVKMRGVRWHGTPTWSRDGQWVAFDATSEAFNRAEVYAYAVDGPQKGTLKNLGPGQCPKFSPDGKTIAFHLEPANAAAQQHGVWLMKPDGTERRRLCDGDHPHWSPDGKKLLVAHERATPAALDEVTVENAQATRVLDSKYAKIPGAVYAPDGRRIAFIGYADTRLSTAELVVLDLAAAKGAGAEAVTAAADTGAEGDAAAAAGKKVLARGRIGWIPNWSPDGKQVVYTTWEKVDGSDFDFCHVIDAEGKTPPVKLKNQEEGTKSTEAEWSPDGKTLVFSSDRPFPADQLAERPDPPASGL